MNKIIENKNNVVVTATKQSMKIKTKLVAGDGNKLATNHNAPVKKLKLKTRIVAGDGNKLASNHNARMI